jgi:hypothetical protein
MRSRTPAVQLWGYGLRRLLSTQKFNVGKLTTSTGGETQLGVGLEVDVRVVPLEREVLNLGALWLAIAVVREEALGTTTHL